MIWVQILSYVDGARMSSCIRTPWLPNQVIKYNFQYENSFTFIVEGKEAMLCATFSMELSPKPSCCSCNMQQGWLGGLTLRTDMASLPTATPTKMSSSTGQPPWTTIHMEWDVGWPKVKQSSSTLWLARRDCKQPTWQYLKAQLFMGSICSGGGQTMVQELLVPSAWSSACSQLRHRLVSRDNSSDLPFPKVPGVFLDH